MTVMYAFSRFIFCRVCSVSYEFMCASDLGWVGEGGPKLYSKPADFLNTVCFVWNPALTITQKHSYRKIDGTNANIEFLQPYHVVADTLLEIGSTVISGILYLDKELSHTLFTPKSCCLIDTLLSVYAHRSKRFRCEVMLGSGHTVCLTPRSHIRNWMSSGLATRVTVTWVSRGR